MDVALATEGKPDAGDLDRATLDVRPTDALTADADAFDVVIPEAAWKSMLEHSNVRLDVEVGGVLIGKPVIAEHGRPYLLIDAGIPALAADSRETNITFTAEAWTHIHEIIDRDHAGASIVGWYHTHPSFGIFLSEMDLFIQHHFFDLPHQVAIVIDPVANTHGCFIWRAGQPTLARLSIEGETISSETSHDVYRGPIPWTQTAAPLTEASFASHRHRRSFVREFNRVYSRAVTLVDPLTRLDGAQWAALLTLLLIAGVLFGSLLMLMLDVHPFAQAGAAAP